jgi:hypothetical protein
MEYVMRVAFFTAVVLMGCGTLFSGFKEYCADAVDCLDGNEDDEQACLVDIDNTRRIARVYGCEDDYMDYMECMKEDADCESYGRYDYWTAEGDCEDEQEDYLDCLSDESDGSSSSSVNPCDQYVEYLCVCDEENCDSLRTTYQDADSEVQQECENQLDEAREWAATCSEEG